MLNPPYGERIEAMGKAGRGRRADEGAAEEADEPESSTRSRDTPDRALPSDFYAQLAAHWKRTYAPHRGGWTAWVLSPDPKLPSALRLKESRRVPLWNGPIECRMFRFELVLGSAREKAPADAAQG
jgi:putative N6-adenine-specific DNA methylase